MNRRNEIIQQIKDSIHTKDKILQSETLLTDIEKVAELIVSSYQAGGKVLLCGNGGSATDSVHLEGELVGRFKMNRKALPAIAIVSSIATMTAVANDYGFDTVFARQIEALGKRGDIILGFTTSGNSSNILSGLKKAKEIGITTVVFTGSANGTCASEADLVIHVPSADTPRIQESHIMIGHIICGLVEKAMFKNT